MLCCLARNVIISHESFRQGSLSAYAWLPAKNEKAIYLFINSISAPQKKDKHCILSFSVSTKGFCVTSVWRMAARCSLAVRDSLSTSICCLQSEFWLLSVSSFVCRASSSDSFFDNSCFSWSICTGVKQTITSSGGHKQCFTITMLV